MKWTKYSYRPFSARPNNIYNFSSITCGLVCNFMRIAKIFTFTMNNFVKNSKSGDAYILDILYKILVSIL